MASSDARDIFIAFVDLRAFWQLEFVIVHIAYLNGCGLYRGPIPALLELEVQHHAAFGIAHLYVSLYFAPGHGEALGRYALNRALVQPFYFVVLRVLLKLRNEVELVKPLLRYLNACDFVLARAHVRLVSQRVYGYLLRASPKPKVHGDIHPAPLPLLHYLERVRPAFPLDIIADPVLCPVLRAL